MEKTLQILSNATGTNTELLNIKVSPGVGDIVVQLDVLDELKRCANAQRRDSSASINLNSHLDVFHAVLRQVENTPYATAFMNILQHLLSIDPKEDESHIVWGTAEKLLHRAIQVENGEDAKRLLCSAISHKFTCQNCSGMEDDGCCSQPKENEVLKEPASSVLAETEASSIPAVPPPPPPVPPPIPGVPCMPGMPPPPAPPSIPGPPPMPGMPPPPPPPLMPGMPPPPPPPLMPGMPPPPPVPPSIPGPPPIPGMPPPPAPPSIPGLPPPGGPSAAPQQQLPKASTKMKTLSWTKIPPHKISPHKKNLWTTLANSRQYNCLEVIDFKGIEGLFCLIVPKANTEGGTDTVDGKQKKEPKQINLLNGQRSLKINIFLSQFKAYKSNDAIVELIRKGEHKVMGPEKLKDLLKNLPEKEEIEILLDFDGDFQRLGNAEKFLLLLLAVSNYQLRIECMLLKEEFAVNVTYLEPCIESIFKAGDDLMNNKSLWEILRIIMIIGNFLNSGSYAGNAVGIKLSSLSKLTEIRANKSGMNLLHFIAMEIERFNPELLNFTNELSFLENVSKLNIEQIDKDIKDLDLPLQTIKKQLELPSTEEDIKEQMAEFLQCAESQIGHLKNGMQELESLRLLLADFFCEDLPTFKLDECFKIFHTFCEQFKGAIKENIRRIELEKRTLLRQKQKEEQLARKTKHAGSSPSCSPILSQKCRRTSNSSLDSINNKFICSEMSSANGEEFSKDELLEYLKSSELELADKTQRGRPRSRRSSFDRCPDLLKFNTIDNRERLTTTTLEVNERNSVGNQMENIQQDVDTKPERPLSLLQRRLSQNGKDLTLESLPEDKCLATPVSTARRESLQIFIKSNPTIDNDTNSIVKVIKTPMPQTGTIFNFSQSDVSKVNANNVAEELKLRFSNSITSKDETKELNTKGKISPMRLKIPTDCNSGILTAPLGIPTPTVDEVELRHPKISLKTMANVIRLGHRCMSINEEDLKTARKSLKTPTVEQKQFSFSPTRDRRRGSLAHTPTGVNPNLRTPTIGRSVFVWSPERLLPPISSLAKPNNTESNGVDNNFKLNNTNLEEGNKLESNNSTTQTKVEYNDGSLKDINNKSDRNEEINDHQFKSQNKLEPNFSQTETKGNEADNKLESHASSTETKSEDINARTNEEHINESCLTISNKSQRDEQLNEDGKKLASQTDDKYNDKNIASQSDRNLALDDNEYKVTKKLTSDISNIQSREEYNNGSLKTMPNNSDRNRILNDHDIEADKNLKLDENLGACTKDTLKKELNLTNAASILAASSAIIAIGLSNCSENKVQENNVSKSLNTSTDEKSPNEKSKDKQTIATFDPKVNTHLNSRTTNTSNITSSIKVSFDDIVKEDKANTILDSRESKGNKSNTLFDSEEITNVDTKKFTTSTNDASSHEMAKDDKAISITDSEVNTNKVNENPISKKNTSSNTSNTTSAPEDYSQEISKEDKLNTISVFEMNTILDTNKLNEVQKSKGSASTNTSNDTLSSKHSSYEIPKDDKSMTTSNSEVNTNVDANNFIENNNSTNKDKLITDSKVKPLLKVNEVSNITGNTSSSLEVPKDNKAIPNSDFSQENPQVIENSKSKPKTLSGRLVNKLQLPIKKLRSLSPNRVQDSDKAKKPQCSDNPEKSKLLRFAQKLHLTKSASSTKVTSESQQSKTKPSITSSSATKDPVMSSSSGELTKSIGSSGAKSILIPTSSRNTLREDGTTQQSVQELAISKTITGISLSENLETLTGNSKLPKSANTKLSAVSERKGLTNHELESSLEESTSSGKPESSMEEPTPSGKISLATELAKLSSPFQEELEDNTVSKSEIGIKTNSSNIQTLGELEKSNRKTDLTMEPQKLSTHDATEYVSTTEESIISARTCLVEKPEKLSGQPYQGKGSSMEDSSTSEKYCYAMEQPNFNQKSESSMKEAEDNAISKRENETKAISSEQPNLNCPTNQESGDNTVSKSEIEMKTNSSENLNDKEHKSVQNIYHTLSNDDTSIKTKHGTSLTNSSLVSGNKSAQEMVETTKSAKISIARNSASQKTSLTQERSKLYTQFNQNSRNTIKNSGYNIIDNPVESNATGIHNKIEHLSSRTPHNVNTASTTKQQTPVKEIRHVIQNKSQPTQGIVITKKPPKIPTTAKLSKPIGGTNNSTQSKTTPIRRASLPINRKISNSPIIQRSTNSMKDTDHNSTLNRENNLIPKSSVIPLQSKTTKLPSLARKTSLPLNQSISNNQSFKTSANSMGDPGHNSVSKSENNLIPKSSVLHNTVNRGNSHNNVHSPSNVRSNNKSKTATSFNNSSGNMVRSSSVAKISKENKSLAETSSSSTNSRNNSLSSNKNTSTNTSDSANTKRRNSLNAIPNKSIPSINTDQRRSSVPKIISSSKSTITGSNPKLINSQSSVSGTNIVLQRKSVAERSEPTSQSRSTSKNTDQRRSSVPKIVSSSKSSIAGSNPKLSNSQFSVSGTNIALQRKSVAERSEPTSQSRSTSISTEQRLSSVPKIVSSSKSTIAGSNPKLSNSQSSVSGTNLALQRKSVAERSKPTSQSRSNSISTDQRRSSVPIIVSSSNTNIAGSNPKLSNSQSSVSGINLALQRKSVAERSKSTSQSRSTSISTEKRRSSIPSTLSSSNTNVAYSNQKFGNKNIAISKLSGSPKSKPSLTSTNNITSRKPTLSITGKPNLISSVSSITSANSLQCRVNLNSKSNVRSKSNTSNTASSGTKVTSANPLEISLTTRNVIKNANSVMEDPSPSMGSSGSRNIKICRKTTSTSQLPRIDVKVKATILNPFSKNAKSN